MEYIAFINGYLNLGYMHEISQTCALKDHCFVSHHCVIQAESTSTRLKVVVDLSTKTTIHLSLSDILYSGKVIRDEMWIILLIYWLSKIVFSTDIEKMHRQIIIYKWHPPFHLFAGFMVMIPTKL